MENGGPIGNGWRLRSNAAPPQISHKSPPELRKSLVIPNANTSGLQSGALARIKRTSGIFINLSLSDVIDIMFGDGLILINLFRNVSFCCWGEAS
jgi:hypothetical protein